MSTRFKGVTEAAGLSPLASIFPGLDLGQPKMWKQAPGVDRKQYP